MKEGVPLALSPVPGELAVCRMGPEAEIPPWADSGPVWSVTRTPEELSVIAPWSAVPEAVQKEGPWAALQVEGPLDFALTGVLARLTAPLAEAGISIFALSTYDTDYLLVRAEAFRDACRCLRQAGFEVRQRDSPQAL